MVVVESPGIGVLTTSKEAIEHQERILKQEQAQIEAAQQAKIEQEQKSREEIQKAQAEAEKARLSLPIAKYGNWISNDPSLQVWTNTRTGERIFHDEYRFSQNPQTYSPGGYELPEKVSYTGSLTEGNVTIAEGSKLAEITRPENIERYRSITPEKVSAIEKMLKSPTAEFGIGKIQEGFNIVSQFKPIRPEDVKAYEISTITPAAEQIKQMEFVEKQPDQISFDLGLPSLKESVAKADMTKPSIPKFNFDKNKILKNISDAETRLKSYDKFIKDGKFTGSEQEYRDYQKTYSDYNQNQKILENIYRQREKESISTPLLKYTEKISKELQTQADKLINVSNETPIGLRTGARGFTEFFTSLPEFAGRSIFSAEQLVRHPSEIPKIATIGLPLFVAQTRTSAVQDPYRFAGGLIGMAITPKLIDVGSKQVSKTPYRVGFGEPKGILVKTSEMQIYETPKTPTTTKDLTLYRKSEPDFFVGEPKTTIREVKTPRIIEGKRIETGYKYTEKTSPTYLKVPKEKIPEFLKSSKGEVEYIKTPEGSFMVIKGAKPISTEPLQRIEGKTTIQKGSKLPRIERKETLTPARFIEEKIIDRPQLEARNFDIEAQVVRPKGKSMDIKVKPEKIVDVRGKTIFEGSEKITGIERSKLTAARPQELIFLKTTKAKPVIEENFEIPKSYQSSELSDFASDIKNIFKTKETVLEAKPISKTPIQQLQPKLKLKVQAIERTIPKQQIPLFSEEIITPSVLSSSSIANRNIFGQATKQTSKTVKFDRTEKRIQEEKTIYSRTGRNRPVPALLNRPSNFIRNVIKPSDVIKDIITPSDFTGNVITPSDLTKIKPEIKPDLKFEFQTKTRAETKQKDKFIDISVPKLGLKIYPQNRKFRDTEKKIRTRKGRSAYTQKKRISPIFEGAERLFEEPKKSNKFWNI